MRGLRWTYSHLWVCMFRGAAESLSWFWFVHPPDRTNNVCFRNFRLYLTHSRSLSSFELFMNVACLISVFDRRSPGFWLYNCHESDYVSLNFQLYISDRSPPPPRMRSRVLSYIIRKRVLVQYHTHNYKRNATYLPNPIAYYHSDLNVQSSHLFSMLYAVAPCRHGRWETTQTRQYCGGKMSTARANLLRWLQCHTLNRVNM